MASRRLARSAHLSARFSRGSSYTALPAAGAVDRLNKTLEKYPLSSFSAHLATSFGTFGIACAALQVVGFDAPALAVAGVVSRCTKRFRMPVDISLAAALANAAPWANALKLAPLLTAPMAALDQQKDQLPKPTKLEQSMIDFTNWAQGPVDKYGGSYMLVHWCTGLTTVSLTYACVNAGLDVMQVLSSLPFVPSGDSSAEALQYASSKASCVAGGMLINTLTLPFRLYLLSLFGIPGFEALERQRGAYTKRAVQIYKPWLRQYLRDNPSAGAPFRRLEMRAAQRSGEGAGGE